LVAIFSAAFESTAVFRFKESKIFREVRRIKEDMAREAESDPDYYQRLSGLGASLLAKFSAVPGAESPTGAYALHEQPVQRPSRK